MGLNRFEHEIAPQSVADTNGLKGVYRVAVSAVGVSVQLPPKLRALRDTLGANGTGPFICVAAKGTDVQWSLSPAAVTVAIDQISTPPGAANPAAGYDLGNGREQRKQVPIGCQYLNVVGTGSGFVSFYMSEGGQL